MVLRGEWAEVIDAQSDSGRNAVVITLRLRKMSSRVFQDLQGVAVNSVPGI